MSACATMVMMTMLLLRLLLPNMAGTVSKKCFTETFP